MKNKIRSKKKGSASPKAIKKVAPYFSYCNGSGVVDLSKEALCIKTTVDIKELGKTSAKINLELWEIQEKGTADRGKGFLLSKIYLDAKESGGKWILSVDRVEQDEKKFPKQKSKSGSDLWLPFKIKLMDKDASIITGGAGLELVLPALEYDDILELQLGSSIGEPKCGVANVTWSAFDKMLAPLKIIDKKAEFSSKDLQAGRLQTIVLHCMNAINSVSKPSECYDIDKNIEILKSYHFSAHFIIGREGELYQLVDINRYAAHAGGANTQSVGIELFGFADDFRTLLEKNYAKYEKLLSDRETLDKKRMEYQKAEEAGKTRVGTKGKEVKTEDAIKKTEDAIKKLGEKINAKKAWADDYQEFVKDKDDKGVPLVFQYTEKQYEALGQLLAVIGRRYGYKTVRSHHSISPDRKKDPGIYFDWGKVTPYLLKGNLAGDETGKGGIYTVGN